MLIFNFAINLGCGLASQIGYSTGIPSIGVAKNFGGSGLKQFGISDKAADEFEKATNLFFQFQNSLILDDKRRV